MRLPKSATSRHSSRVDLRVDTGVVKRVLPAINEADSDKDSCVFSTGSLSPLSSGPSSSSSSPLVPCNFSMELPTGNGLDKSDTKAPTLIIIPPTPHVPAYEEGDSFEGGGDGFYLEIFCSKFVNALPEYASMDGPELKAIDLGEFLQSPEDSIYNV